MKWIAKADEYLYIYSMGKRLRITAIFTDEDRANEYMAKKDEGVVACFGSFIFMANLNDKGHETQTKEWAKRHNFIIVDREHRWTGGPWVHLKGRYIFRVVVKPMQAEDDGSKSRVFWLVFGDLGGPKAEEEVGENQYKEAQW